jgi:hypothetical protein
MKNIKLSNFYFLEKKGEMNIVNFLDEQQLHGKQSRSRTRFIKSIADRYKEVNGYGEELVIKYADRNKKKEIIYIDKDNKEVTEKRLSVRYKISDENIKKVNEELYEYLNEGYVIDITPANTEMLKDIKDIILNTTNIFKGKDASLYNEWCEIFEKGK